MKQVLVFYDEAFPFAGLRPTREWLNLLKEKFTVVDSKNLEMELRNPVYSSFIHMHGPYFPKRSWGHISSFLEKGKGLLYLGGIPFRKPCNFINGSWEIEREQTGYHMHLNIHEALSVKSKDVKTLNHNKEIPLLDGFEALFSKEDTYNFILHVTKKSSIEKEMGSNGPMDARIYPLLTGENKGERKITAPVVLIENYKGKFPGGRWIFINQELANPFYNEQSIHLLENLSQYMNCGVTEIWLKTNYACYEVNESPAISLQFQSIHKKSTEWTFELKITKDHAEVFTHSFQATVSSYLGFKRIHPDITISPGLYNVVCTATSNAGEKLIYKQGFWGMDRSLLSKGEPLAVDRDYFRKNGKPLPIVGMTYMTSDVSRYFLFLPNPAVWDRDFAQMKKANINYVRTGIWTAYRNIMFVDGHVSEEVLRALDAFVLCAKKYEIDVTFCFFSFTPEMWDGENPYLDPRSVEAQKRFITTIVQRHKETKNLNWDLINEPSMFDPDRGFSGPRSLHDSYDKKEFRKWLKNKHRTIENLQENWNATPAEIADFNSIDTPEPSEINSHIQNMAWGNRGLKWFDYTFYTMDMHNKWAKDLTAAIKHFTPDQLVTVGQDEALTSQRPSPMFYEEAVDYTTNHSWWFMDQLLWDSIFTKAPNKPNLIQETGIMYVERPDNIAKRTEEELRNILERKYAYSFAGAGAGAVQWIWNTNYFMNNINESNIGALRADGTEKPEADVSYDFGAFMKDISHIFEGRKMEEVAVIFPFSNDFSNRRLAFDSTARLTRVMACELNVAFRAISEYHLDDLRINPSKLIIVPSAHTFNTNAFEKLLEIVEATGATLLYTGPISLDEYWNKTERAKRIVGKTSVGNIRREEFMFINNTRHLASFPDKRIAEVMKEIPLDCIQPTEIQQYKIGKGKLLWSPLSIELNERNEPISELYKYALNVAGVTEDLRWIKGNYPGIYGRKLSFHSEDLFIFVSECGEDIEMEIQNTQNGTTYEFLLEAERSVLFAAGKDGKLIGVYRDHEVSAAVIQSGFTHIK
ncbi:beta-galactosidase [Metabacillus dongyingensis]|uniref:beta-galactosidase n=1 Tax=Metabacillus dongyingensis TaxID=2874282 RepID=UPI001CBB89D7|nr:beta-galactosidase [Metabacillus dongyingensis]UAL52059.1 beta-galactosidase [Metabacillus dongyingensis]